MITLPPTPIPIVYNISYQEAMRVCSGFEACYSPKLNAIAIGIDPKDERYTAVYWHEIGHSKLEGVNLKPVFPSNNWWWNEVGAWGYSDWKLGKLDPIKDKKYIKFYQSLK